MENKQDQRPALANKHGLIYHEYHYDRFFLDIFSFKFDLT